MVEQKRWAHLLWTLLVVLLLSPWPWVAGADWVSSSDFHSCIEIVGSWIAVTAGMTCLIRFYGQNDRVFLVLGLGFFVSGAEDFVHGLLSFTRLMRGVDVDFTRYIPATYVAGRTVLGLMIVLSAFLERILGQSRNVRREALVCTLGAIVLSAAATALAFRVPLPQFIYPERFVSRPVDFLSALIFLVGMILYARKYAVTGYGFYWWIVTSCIFNFVGQLYMAHSSRLYDAWFDIAHIANVLSYLAPVLGVASELTQQNRTVRKSREALEQEITARIRAQEQLLQLTVTLESRVARRTRQLKKTQTELVAKAFEAGRAQFAAIVMHNIGNAITPLTLHIGQFDGRRLEMLHGRMRQSIDDLKQHRENLGFYVNEDVRGQRVFKYLEELVDRLAEERAHQAEMHSQARDSLAYIADILDAQRGESDWKHERRVQVSLNKKVQTVVRMERVNLGKSNIDLDVQLGPDLSDLYIDKSRIMQLLLNLVKNSQDAIEALESAEDIPEPLEKKIRIVTAQNSHSVVLEIHDTGIGVDADKLDRIFEFGVSGKDSSGMGLYYCRQFLERNGGTISLASPGRGKGTCVTVQFNAA